MIAGACPRRLRGGVGRAGARLVAGVTGRCEPRRRLPPHVDLVRDRRRVLLQVDRQGVEEGVERVQVMPELGVARLICFGHAPRVSAACQTAALQSDAPGVSRANDGLYPDGF